MPKPALIILAVTVVSALAGGGWFYLHRGGETKANALTPYGDVDIREVQPAFNDSGHITTMLVQKGARVKRGELLATLDDSARSSTRVTTRRCASAPSGPATVLCEVLVDRTMRAIPLIPGEDQASGARR
jgi:hypothetical protein